MLELQTLIDLGFTPFNAILIMILMIMRRDMKEYLDEYIDTLQMLVNRVDKKPDEIKGDILPVPEDELTKARERRMYDE